MFSCDVCNKVFNTRGNYNQHVARHNDVNQHQCNECGKVFARRYNYLRHLHSQHNIGESAAQRGYGAPDEPAAKRQRVSDDVRSMYQVTRMREVNMKKFKTKGLEYIVKFNDDVEVQDRASIVETLHRVFQNIIDTVTEGTEPHDLIRMVVVHPELDYPITLPFIAKQHLTAERFLSRVETVLQSYEEFTIDGTLEIHVTQVAIPQGSKATKKRYVDIERFLKEKQCIIQIVNKDELCCARAIITAKAKIDQHEKWEAIRKGCKLQQTLAEELHRQAGVPLAKCGIDEIKQFQQVLPHYQLVVCSKDYANAVIYRGPSASKQICLYHHDDHYDVITSMPAFLNRSYFCVECLKGYDHTEDHRCRGSCYLCFQPNCDEVGDWVYCQECNRHFKSAMCFDNHLKPNTRGTSVCKTHFRCPDCDQFVSRRRLRAQDHRCGEKFCKVCREFVPPDHLCYMRPVAGGKDKPTDEELKEKEAENTKDDDDVTSYIFFDFECVQETGIHEPNLCIAHKVCSQCMEGENVTSCQQCGKSERVFAGPNTRQDFCKWLFSEENARAIVLCHNFKGYDSYFVLRYLYDNAVLPEVIFNGAKVMSITVPANDMKFIDSFNFLPMALSKLPGAFGLKELAKGYFPHLFNTWANQSCVLPHLPEMHYYNPDSMKSADRQTFVKWYEEHINDTFDFQQEIVKYCRSDVDILRRCCLSFRSLFMEMTADEKTPGIDPFQHCITIASACNLVYRTKYLDTDTIAIIPPNGYPSNDRQSAKALQWLKWLTR